MSYRKPKFEAVLSPPRYSEGHRRRQRDVNIFAKLGSGSCRVLSECGGNGRAALPSERARPAAASAPDAFHPPKVGRWRLSGSIMPARARVMSRVCPRPLRCWGPRKRLLSYPGPGPWLRAPRPLACAPRGRCAPHATRPRVAWRLCATAATRLICLCALANIPQGRK